MSTSYDEAGRARQKQRTRDALVTAARTLVAAGAEPTVEAAAAAASVSRATAYRYFPNQRALLIAAHPETAARTLLTGDPPTDPAERLDDVVRAFTDLIVATEAQQRTMLRLSLETDPAARHSDLPLRQGRAIGWIAEALTPLQGRLSDEALHLLTLAIRSATGIEALVWLTDIAGLSRGDAVLLMRWSARSLLHAAMTGRPPGATIGP
jgi:AcrR family transcriptional regulator